MENYKQQHEKFLEGLNGGTFGEIVVLLSIIPASVLCNRIIYSYINSTREKKFQREHSFLNFFLEFSLTVLPMLISMTKTEYTYTILWILLGISLFLSLFSFWQGNPLITLSGDMKDAVVSLSGQRKPFIDEYRTAILLNTFIAILAVDFPVFPRRFAKTETYGVSLMDVGVGSFLLASALTSKHARSSIRTDKDKKTMSYFSLVLSALKSVSPLLVIGLIRVISVKSTNYQEHVTEYGVHWNFFFTLAFVTLFCTIFVPLNLPGIFHTLLGIAILIGYQICLTLFGLKDFILSDERTNILSQNKEGIFSTIGYIALYLIGSHFGNEIMKPRFKINEWKSFAVKLLVLDGIFWLLVAFSSSQIEDVSRRMANLSYVLTVTAYNIFVIALVLFVFLITKPTENTLITAINYNGLTMFLLSNLSTGLVNFSMKTIYASDTQALVILTVYMLFICSIATFLYKKKILLKYCLLEQYIEQLDLLSNLVYLDLSHNHITKIENLSKLYNLKELNLSENRITKWENLEILKKLEVLNLNGNTIERLPKVQFIKPLQSLRILRLERNKIGELKDFIALATCSNLTSLSIKGNPICDLPHHKEFVTFYLKTINILDGENVSVDERRLAIARFSRVELDSLSQKLEKLKLEKKTTTEQLSHYQSEFQKLENSIKSLQEEVRLLKDSKIKAETALDVKSQMLNKKTSELSQMADILFSLKQELEYYKISNVLVGDINEFGLKEDSSNSIERESIHKDKFPSENKNQLRTLQESLKIHQEQQYSIASGVNTMLSELEQKKETIANLEIHGKELVAKIMHEETNIADLVQDLVDLSEDSVLSGMGSANMKIFGQNRKVKQLERIKDFYRRLEANKSRLEDLIKIRKKELSETSEDRELKEQEIELISKELHKRIKENATIAEFLESCHEIVKLLQSKSGSVRSNGSSDHNEIKASECIKKSEKIQEKIDDIDALMITLYREFKENDESVILGEREVSRLENQLLSMEQQAKQIGVEIQRIEEEIKGFYFKKLDNSKQSIELDNQSEKLTFLEDQLLEKDKVISELQRIISKLNDSQIEKENETNLTIQTLTSENSSLKNQLLSLNIQMKELKEEMNLIKSKELKILNENLQFATKETENIKNENIVLKSQTEVELSGELEDLKDSILQAQLQIESQNKEIDQKILETESLKTNFIQQKNEFDAQKKKIKEDIESLNREHRTLHVQRDNLHLEIQSLETKLGQHHSRLSGQQEQSEDLDKQLKDSQQQLEETKSMLFHQIATFEKKQQEIENIEDVKQGILSEIQDLQDQVKTLQNEEEQLSSLKSEIKNQISDAQKAFASEIENNKKELENQLENLQSVIPKYKEVSAEKETLETKTKELRHEIEQLQVEKNQLQQQIKLQNQNLETVGQQTLQVQIKLKNVLQEYHSHLSEMRDSQEQSTTAKKQLQTLNEEIQNRKQELDQIFEELNLTAKLSESTEVDQENIKEEHAKQLREQKEIAESEISANKEKIEDLTLEKNNILKNIQQLVQQEVQLQARVKKSMEDVRNLQKEEESLVENSKRFVSENQSLQEKLIMLRQAAQLEKNSLKDHIIEQQDEIKRLHKEISLLKEEHAKQRIFESNENQRSYTIEQDERKDMKKQELEISMQPIENYRDIMREFSKTQAEEHEALVSELKKLRMAISQHDSKLNESLNTSTDRLAKIEVERLKIKLSTQEKQQKQDIANLQKVYEAKEERIVSKLKQQQEEFKQREVEYLAQVDVLRTQIKSTLANFSIGKENIGSEIRDLLSEFTKMNQKMNKQLEELKKERKLKIETVELENKLKEKQAQINFLISQLQTLKEQKNQLEKSNGSDQSLIEDLFEQLQKLQTEVAKLKTIKIENSMREKSFELGDRDQSPMQTLRSNRPTDKFSELMALKEEIKHLRNAVTPPISPNNLNSIFNSPGDQSIKSEKKKLFNSFAKSPQESDDLFEQLNVTLQNVKEPNQRNSQSQEILDSYFNLNSSIREKEEESIGSPPRVGKTDKWSFTPKQSPLSIYLEDSEDKTLKNNQFRDIINRLKSERLHDIKSK